MAGEVINGKVVSRWFTRGKARIPIFEDGSIGTDRYVTQGIEDREKLKGETREQRQKWNRAFYQGHTREYYEKIRDEWAEKEKMANTHSEYITASGQKNAWDKQLVKITEREDTFNGIYDYPTEAKDVSKEIDYNAKTRKERYANYTTPKIEAGREARAREIDKVNNAELKTAPITKNNVEQLKKYNNGLNKLEKDYSDEKISRKEFDSKVNNLKNEYNNKIDKLNKDWKREKALKSRDLYSDIHNEYTPEEIEYITQNGDVRKMNSYEYPKERDEYHQYLQDKYGTYKEEEIKENWKKLREDFYSSRKDTEGDSYSDALNKIKKDLSRPYVEQSDGTYADPKNPFTKRTSSELRKQIKELEPYTEELQVGNRVIINTGGGRYGVRNVGDEDDPMTDYSAYVYGFNAKSIIQRAREQGIVTDAPKASKTTEAQVERFKERKGKSNSIENLSKRELAEKLVENQISRGMSFNNKENVIKSKMKMSKEELLKYFK